MAEAVRTIHFHPEPAAESARRLAEHLASGGLRLAVAGGSVAPVLGAARRLLGPKLWRTVQLTWVDERCVPFAHPDSNRGSAYRGGHLEASDPPGLELPLYLDGETPEAACDRVRNAFRRDFGGGLDVLLLGLGEDGHIASLFPGGESRGDTVLHVAHSPKPPPSRITFTLAVLAKAPAAMLLALGEAKREALSRLRQGDPALPASALQRLDVLTDLAAFPSGDPP